MVVRYLTVLMLALLLTNCTPSSKLSKARQWTSDQIQLVEGEADRPLRVYKITNHTDSLLLRTPSQPVVPDSTDAILQRFVDRLYATVRDSMSMGVGIAAPQVGILKQIIYVQRFDKSDHPFEVYLNPKITSYSPETQECKEGCLSIPDRSDVMNSRSKSITITYDRMDHSSVTEVVEGFTAVIFQHEIDHLDGILYLDHLAREAAK